MGKTLVIVESPAKAKTINKFLGTNYIVKSSFGHLRDLPKSKMGIDIENNFEPHYINNRAKTKVIKELKDNAKKTDSILFATDEDREGEAIAWHLSKILDVPEDQAKRIVFHEITKNAILDAIKNPRMIDMELVNAQQARRILDRLVGYELSPFLWKKVIKGLSAGRVQSVAVRLVVEKEKEIQNFKPQEYWNVEGLFEKEKIDFTAKLIKQDGKKIDKLTVENKKQADEISKDLKGEKYFVENIEEKQTKKNPLPPFTTSTLQQTANNRLGFSAKQTMRLAQQLYEGVDIGTDGSVGLITYMRTDSLNLSKEFLGNTTKYIKQELGEKYLAEKTRLFKSKSKNAQEAHEAIRPTHVEYAPEKIKNHLDKNQLKLYTLIWQRAIATQMAPAIMNKISLDIKTKTKEYVFRANGQSINFDGYLKIYTTSTKENILPNFEKGEDVNCKKMNIEQHFTEPPARYSDASLIKILEEYGVGRPSTYAPTLATIEARGYVKKNDQKRFEPNETAFMVIDILVKHFPQVVDYQFTAKMEDDLDKIAEGKQKWQPLIAEFYFPFKENLEKKYEEVKKLELDEKTDEICDKCGKPMIIKTGRFGKFLGCSGFPECKNIKSVPGTDKDKNGQPDSEQVQKLQEKFEGEVCEKCGTKMAVKVGRYGPFLACTAFPKCRNIKKIPKEDKKPEDK